MNLDCENKFISILSHVQKESMYSLQTTGQVFEANDILHSMKAYTSISRDPCEQSTWENNRLTNTLFDVAPSELINLIGCFQETHNYRTQST